MKGLFACVPAVLLSTVQPDAALAAAVVETLIGHVEEGQDGEGSDGGVMGVTTIAP